MSIVHQFSAYSTLFALAAIMLSIATACSSSRNVEETQTGEIVVQGLATMRGHMPFPGLVLVTNDRNSYVLTMHDEAALIEMEKQAPARFRVTGVPYKDFWQGTDRAHLRVVTWEKVD